MITLTLLHSNKDIPVQSWTFEQELVIRIGRATDNHVVLYSAVVSRHHVELRCTDSTWEVMNLGTNGTYVDGKRVTQVPLTDGATIRLARSGPNIQIHLGNNALQNISAISGENTVSQRGVIKGSEVRSDQEAQAEETPAPVSPSLAEPEPHHEIVVSELSSAIEPAKLLRTVAPASVCQHPRIHANSRFCLDCGQPIQVKQVVQGYQIVDTLGQGGMGITYLAWREGQSVVLKTLNAEWINHTKALELFQREATFLKQLSHTGIPRFIDFFFEAVQPYLVMEMVYGHDLARQVAISGAVSQQQAIAWMLEVCDVLEYLHNQSPPMIHRDIKPNNLIRRSVPRLGYEIAVVDFGAVKSLQMEAGTRIGSVGYTAPEQQEGHAIPASDLYAVGSTLVYLITGQDPSNFYRHQDQELRLHVEVVPGLSPEMQFVIHTLTQPQPEQRYTTAAELAEALRHIPS